MARPRFLMIPLDVKSNKSIMEEVKNDIVYDYWIKPYSVERYLFFDKDTNSFNISLFFIFNILV